MKLTLYLAAAGLVAALCPGNQLWSQTADDNRSLSGSVDLGDVGRYVGPLKLGEIVVSSNQFTAPVPADPTVPAAPVTQHSINIAKDGFAWLGNGLFVRNGSGQDLVFDGQNPDSQSHSLDIYYFGTGSGPTDRFGNGAALGSFDIQNFSLDASPTNQYQNSAGDTTTTFGGYWFQRGVYRNDSDSSTVIEQQPAEPSSVVNRTTSPVTLQHGRSIENNGTFNRAASTQPSVLSDTLRGLFAAPLRLVEDETQTAERRNALFAVQPSAPENAGTLDLSGIEISVQGTSVADRQLFGPTVNLGRRLVGGPDEVISRTDEARVSTFGSDDLVTRLNLNSFSQSNDGVTASVNSSTDFTSADTTADVSLTANFTIDGAQTGTFFQGVDAGANITSLEQLDGESVQNRLNLGYRYSVVDENEAESSSLSVYKIDDFDTTGEVNFNDTARAVYSANAHTAITVDSRFVLDGSDVQSVTLSNENGITGENLAGEQVTATTTYSIHTQSVQSSDLESTPEGNVGESPITIENARVASDQLQATAYLNRATREGSDRWFFEADDSLNLEAGESVTLTPMFDEVGLQQDDLALGRNFRTTVSLTYQDGFLATDADAVSGTENIRSTSRFDIYGSDSTAQTLSWVLERELAVTAEAGTIDLASGISLRDEGINLTNTLENSTDDFLTTVRLLDGIVVADDQSPTQLSLAFERLNEASENQSGAAGFDELTSDIVEVNGLDGTLHTLEISYNADLETLIDDASLRWFDDGDAGVLDDGAWVNAVLGNSNVLSYDLDADLIELLGDEGTQSSLSEYLENLQFNSSYTDYLFDLESGGPQLGAHGFDIETGVAWAVIDHNSSFSTTVTVAVPEPSSAIALSVIAIGTLIRRRRVASA